VHAHIPYPEVLLIVDFFFTLTGTRLLNMSLEDYAREKSAHRMPTAKPGTEGPNLQLDVRKEKVELVDITEKERWGDRSVISLTSSRHQAKAEVERFSEYALVLRRYVDRDGDRVRISLEVRSSIIRVCLKENLQDYPYLNIHSTPIVIYAPYPPLFHYMLICNH
jgi:hypothetical protein